MDNKIQFQFLLKLVIVSVLLFSLIIGSLLPIKQANAMGEKDDDWIYNEDTPTCNIEPAKEKHSSTSKEDEGIKISGTSSGAWLKKGTKQYKAAKGVFESFTDEYGTSGAFAAGVLANIARESDFNGAVKEKENGQNYAGRGYGYFQFTPAEKYLNSKEAKGKPSEPSNQVAYVWNSEFGNKAVEPMVTGSAGASAGIKMYGDKPFDSLEDLLSVDDPARGAEGFHDGYERGDVGLWHDKHAMTSEYAKKANDVFNKDDIKADKSKLKKNLKGGKSGKNIVDTGDDKSKKDKDENICKSGSKKKDDGAKGAGWGKDGTGDPGMKPGKGFNLGWMPDKLPKKLKKYALDPKLVNLGWKKSKNWKGGGLATNGQCTNFSSSFFALIWTTDGKSPTFNKAQGWGNGSDNASAAARNYGGKTTHSPSKGAVFSEAPFSNGTEESGHTGIVSHVFKTGDVLLVEQNVGPVKGGGSGDNGGPHNPMTWNYRLIGKSEAKSYTYYTAEKSKKYKVNNKLKK